MTAEPALSRGPPSGSASPATPPWARAVIDYAGPLAFLLGFFVMHRNLAAATWWLVGGSAVALAVSLAVTRRIAPMPLLWGGAALVFGVLTLVLHDTRFVKIKTTVIDGALGTFLLGSWTLRRGKPGGGPLRLLLGEAVKLSDEGWRALTWRYGVFFLVMAALNELVWRTQSDAVWVLFRMPGLLILAGLFALTQLPMMLGEAKRAEAAAALTELQE